MRKEIPTWLKLLAELFIVVFGVYIAFWLNGYADAKKEKEEKEKVLMSVKKELERFKVFMPIQEKWQRNLVKEWSEAFKNDSITDYYSWRYLEPQYNYEIINYALNKYDANIVTFEMHVALSEIYTYIRHLEHAERLMTETAQKAVFIPKDLPKSSSEYKVLKSQNRTHYYHFINFANDRANSQKVLGEKSKEVLKLINAQFSEEQVREIERQLIISYIALEEVQDLEEIKGLILQNYENFTEEEIIELYEEARKSGTE